MTLIPPQPEPTGAARVDMHGIGKRFGAFSALDDVSMTVEAGSFHALLGENGAGKSTLVKCLIGFYRADAGQVSVDGRERAISGPSDAAQLGLGMIFQHFTVVPGMTVAENLALADRALPAVVDWRAQRQRLADFMRSAPFALDLDAPVANLAAGEKQKLEILKQLYARRRFLILDEPTSVLTPQEADEVLGQVQALARSGVLSVLLITHKFREVFAYCDEVTVLRRGRHAGHSRVADTTRDALAGWMMGAAEGRAADQAAISGAGAAQPGGEPVGGGAAADVLPPTGAARLAVRDLVVLGANGRHAVGRLSLEVAPGEIVGIAGISGNGQRELVAALTGVLPIASGRIEVDGKPYRATRRQMREFRLRSLPEEPLVNACVGRLSVAENIALRNFDVAPLSRAGWLSHRAVQRQAHERIERFRVRPPRPDAPIETLSGGNVQRAVLSRELSDPPRLLIVANPCFGLDFQATNEIHARLRAARDGGAGILLVSEDLDELLALSTRLLVLSHGNVAYACNAGGQPVDITAVGRAMAGDTHAADARQAA